MSKVLKTFAENEQKAVETLIESMGFKPAYDAGNPVIDGEKVKAEYISIGRAKNALKRFSIINNSLYAFTCKSCLNEFFDELEKVKALPSFNRVELLLHSKQSKAGQLEYIVFVFDKPIEEACKELASVLAK